MKWKGETRKPRSYNVKFPSWFWIRSRNMLCFIIMSQCVCLLPPAKDDRIHSVEIWKSKIHFDIVRGNKKGWKINNRMSMYTCNPGLNLRAVLSRSWMTSVCNLINDCCNTSGEALRHIVFVLIVHLNYCKQIM